MPKSEKQIIKMLEKASSEMGNTLTFILTVDGFVSEKAMRLDGVDEKITCTHRIAVDEDYDEASSSCILKFPTALDASAALTTVNTLNNIYGQHFSFDADKRTLSATIKRDMDFFDIAPINKWDYYFILLTTWSKPLNLFGAFIFPSAFYGKILYLTYTGIVEHGYDVQRASDEADRDVSKNMVYYRYKYDYIGPIVKEKGDRYYIEHHAMREAFHKNPDGIIYYLKTQGYRFAVRLLDDLQDDYDIPHITDYYSLTSEVVQNNPNKNCVHLHFPHSKNAFECTDVMFSTSKDKNFYYIIEKFPKGMDNPPQYTLEGWDNTGEKYFFGWFETRDSAMESWMETIREN